MSKKRAYIRKRRSVHLRCRQKAENARKVRSRQKIVQSPEPASVTFQVAATLWHRTNVARYCSMFDRITVRTGDKYFFVDHDGKQIGATYDGAAMVAANDGYAAVKVGSQWGFADAKGELVIQPQYENARSFSLGLAPVEENDRWGYINTDGELVVEEKYFDAGVFSPDGAACVKSVAAWSFLVLCEYDS